MLMICIYKLIYLLRSNIQRKMTKNAKLINAKKIKF